MTFLSNHKNPIVRREIVDYRMMGEARGDPRLSKRS